MPERVGRAYESQLAALIRYQALGVPWLKAQRQYRGLADDEVMDEIEYAVELLDCSGVLEVIAAIEAVFRIDMEQRLHGKKVRPVTRALLALFKAKSPKVPLKDILDVWRGHVEDGTGPIGDLKQIYNRRHWLAHGRHWTDKSGVTPTVTESVRRYTAVATLLRTAEPDFPRAGHTDPLGRAFV